MKLVLQIAAGVFLAACLVNGCAEAGEAATRDEARLGWFMPIARAAWPDSPCAGREQVHLHGDATLDELALSAGFEPLQVRGAADPETCSVWMRSAMPAEEFCVVLVHELGHTAGFEHSEWPGDVMHAFDQRYLPCEVAVQRAAARAARHLLPRHRMRWGRRW